MHGTFIKNDTIVEITNNNTRRIQILPTKENNTNDNENNGHYLMTGQWLRIAIQMDARRKT